MAQLKLSLPLGVYVPGRTVIHRLPAGVKFLVLVVFILAVAVFAREPWQALAATALVATGLAVARIPARVALGQVLPVVPILILLGVFQWWQRGWELAVATVVGILATVAAAALLTLTTTITELMDAFDSGLRPFARFGLPVETITLAMAMTIRLIPLQAAAVHEVLEARKARGLGFSLAALGIPVVIRSVKRARDLGEALMARGVGD